MTTKQERAAGVKAVVFDVDGVLTDGVLFYGTEGEAMKAFHARDGMGMALLRDAGYRMAIISGRRSPAVEHRARELGIEHVEMGCTDKGKAVEALAEKWQLPVDQMAAIGDDLIDWPMLRRVGLSAAPQDADPRLRDRVHCPLGQPGGRGAVRELAEILLRAAGHWPDLSLRFELEEDGA